MSKPERRNGRSARRTRGFSIVEIYVALVIAMIGVLGTVSIFPAGVTSVQSSGDSLQAQAIGQAYLDLIRSYYQSTSNPPPNFAPGQTVTASAPSGEQFRSQIQAPAVYTLSYTVATAPSGENDILLTMNWSDAGGSHTRRYEEYVQS